MPFDSALISHIFSILLTLCMGWVVVSDARHYIIPNWLNTLILTLFVAAVLLLPLAPLAPVPALGAASAVLAVGLLLFGLGLMGGGDVKLLAVLSLWTGWGMTTLHFIFLTAVCGGVLVVLVLAARALLAPLWFKLRPQAGLPRLLTRGEPVPYGIAIAAAFLWLLVQGRIGGLLLPV